MRKIKFPIIKPFITDDEVREVTKVLKSGWLTQGNYVRTLEKNIADFIGVKYAILLNSATTGLIAAVKALELSKNDEVIVPSFSFPATSNSVILGGAKPVFCDIDLETYNIAAEKISNFITRKTKAIMVVHEFGLSANMTEISAIAKKYNLSVIEDAACSFGSEYNKVKLGALGDIGVFSFHPRKVITSGEGGCVVTNSARFAKSIHLARSHGEYNHGFLGVGYNFRLSDIQAAVLLMQFKKINMLISQRIALAKHYTFLLRDMETQGLLKTPSVPSNYRHNFQSYVILLSRKIKRETLRSFLRSKGIESQIGTYCIPRLQYYRKNLVIPKEAYQNAFFAYSHTLTLPLYHTLTIKEQIFIVKTLKKSIKKCAE